MLPACLVLPPIGSLEHHKSLVHMSAPVVNTVSFAHEILQPTAVDHCICANFTSAVESNLVIIKNDVLEIYSITVAASLPTLSSNSAENKSQIPTIAKILDAQQRDPSLAQTSDILTMVSRNIALCSLFSAVSETYLGF